MNHRLARAMLFALTCALLVNVAVSQESNYPVLLNAKPMYKVGPTHWTATPDLAGPVLPLWEGSFTDHHSNRITYTMVGTDPSNTNVTTNVTVVIVPIRMVYGKKNGNYKFDPMQATASNGLTIVKNILASPLFTSGVNFTQGGTDLGTTQYLDAFQRGNFWNFVKTNTSYHILLKHTQLAEQTIIVTPAQGQVVQNPFGSGIIGTYDLNAFDAQLHSIIIKLAKITPGVLPLFVTYDVFLTDGGQCCVGGYHGANGQPPANQTYAFATYEDSVGSFAQDVSVVSREIGEWMDDPYPGINIVGCTDNNYLEVGDPLDGNANYGSFPYTYRGFTYNLHSLVFLGYFGGNRGTSVHAWLSFQNDEASVCPGQ